MPAFSLIELVVSIAILTLMMALVGKIFQVTVDSTGEAQALIEINQAFRLMEETLREDLAGIDPDRSIMIIRGMQVEAYWRAEQKENDVDGDPSNGYPHKPDDERERPRDVINNQIPYRLEQPRADLLLFITSRPGTSAVAPNISSNLMHVFYGHAELGELDNNGDWVSGPVGINPPFYPTYVPLVAEEWHLARRATIIVDAPEEAVLAEIPQAVRDALGGVLPDEPYDDPNRTPYPLRDGYIDIIAQDDANNNLMFLDNDVLNAPLQVGRFNQWVERSRMDITPPPGAANRLGSFFMPRCASFKVEWGFIDPGISGANHSIIWVDPVRVWGIVGETESVTQQCRDAGASLNALPCSAFQAGGRFAIAGAGNDPDLCIGILPPGRPWATHTFFSRNFSVIGGDGNSPDPFFPVALRITVDMFDRAGKLTRPLRHVMVLPVGNTG